MDLNVFANVTNSPAPQQQEALRAPANNASGANAVVPRALFGGLPLAAEGVAAESYVALEEGSADQEGAAGGCKAASTPTYHSMVLEALRGINKRNGAKKEDIRRAVMDQWGQALGSATRAEGLISAALKRLVGSRTVELAGDYYKLTTMTSPRLPKRNAARTAAAAITSTAKKAAATAAAKPATSKKATTKTTVSTKSTRPSAAKGAKARATAVAVAKKRKQTKPTASAVKAAKAGGVKAGRVTKRTAATKKAVAAAATDAAADAAADAVPAAPADAVVAAAPEMIVAA